MGESKLVKQTTFSGRLELMKRIEENAKRLYDNVKQNLKEKYLPPGLFLWPDIYQIRRDD